MGVRKTVRSTVEGPQTEFPEAEAEKNPVCREEAAAGDCYDECSTSV